MRIPPTPHAWSLTPRQAIAVQRRLAGRVRHAAPAALGRDFRFIAGLDAAFTADGGHVIGAAVIWDVRARAVVEQHTALRRVTFPYVPGLLSFRETPAVLAALRKVHVIPDALLCDGHGYAHPRRFGLACHVGVLTGLPTAGCAKSLLVGTYRSLGRRRGARARLVHDGEVIGTVLRTQDGVRPVFVSVGHRLDLAAATRLVLGCSVRFRLPEPTRLADQLVGAARRANPEAPPQG
jgi:deoxyribonuclease V